MYISYILQAKVVLQVLLWMRCENCYIFFSSKY